MSTQTQAVTADTLRLGSPEELKRRLSFIKESDTSRGLLFNSILEVVRRTKGEAGVRHCLEAVGEPKFVDFFSYPLSKFVTLLYAAARLLSAETGDFEGALRQLGQQTATNFLTSTSGKLMMSLVQQNPKRLFNSLRASLQVVATSTDQITTRMTGPASGILTYKHDLLPRPNMEGGLLALFLSANVRGVKVRSWATGPLDNEYEISWE
jgi:uncharacterized protein (TIGR02265 family)